MIDWEWENDLSFDTQFGSIISYLELSVYKLLLEEENVENE